MYFCYVDESGGYEAAAQRQDTTPVMLIAGLIIPASAIPQMTADVLALKQWFYPSVKGHRLNLLLKEIKGSDLRKYIRTSNRRGRSQALTALDRVIKILKKHDGQLVGRIWVKAPHERLEPTSTYTFAIQDIARHFEHFLAAQSAQGIMVCDSRDHKQNTQVAHSVFTRKHKATGDEVPNLLEVPLFASSENHAGLQLVDLIVSGILFPMTVRAFCSDISVGPHNHPRFDALRVRHAESIKRLRYTYANESGKTLGGITVSDARGHQPSSRLFEVPTSV